MAPQNKENTMLTKFASALLATSLVASSALAAQSSGNSGPMPAVQTGQSTNPAKTATTNKTVKTVNNRSTHARKHLARNNSRMVHHAHHNVPAKTHQASVGKSAKHS
jgi:hypothetical protein